MITWKRLVEERTRELASLNRALKKSEERFRFLVQQVKDYAIIYLDTEGRVVSWNEGAEKIYGYPPDEVLGKHFSIFHLKEAIEQKDPWRMLESAAAEGQFKGEGWRLRRDESRFWADAVVTALRDEAGRPQGFTVVTRNIDEHRKAEEALNYRLAMEELVITISNRFINIPSEALDNGISGALDAVRNFTSADRSYLGLLSDELRVVTLYESLSSDIASRARELEALSLPSLPWLLAELKKRGKQSPYPISPISRQKRLRRRGLGALFFRTGIGRHPDGPGAVVRGYLALNSDEDGKRWASEDVRLLRIVEGDFWGLLEPETVGRRDTGNWSWRYWKVREEK